jgi:indole-3-glycerol phosphate synthase
MTILDRIVEKKRDRVDLRKVDRPESSLERSVREVKPFFREGGTIITECKKASPSKGIMVNTYDPAAIASAYARGGAHALSVLTEEDYFMGSDDHLSSVIASVDLPVIRKDFVIDAYQIKESYALGADAILLIAAILSDAQMKDFAQMAFSFGLSVIAEAHDEYEIERVVRVNGVAVGVNARDLRDFSVDLSRVERMRSLIPGDRIAVAESGIKEVDDMMRMRRAGYDAFLIGERFVCETDPEPAVRGFADALAGRR